MMNNADIDIDEVNERETLEYWIRQSEELMDIIEGKREKITMCLEIASRLRDFYLDGKLHGEWICNNYQRY